MGDRWNAKHAFDCHFALNTNSNDEMLFVASIVKQQLNTHKSML